MNGGRFDFDDGGTYCGGWEDGKAHGHGVCTGPKGQGEYAGAWHYGFEVSGVYTWPSGNTFEGQWQNGKRHGVGIERRGHWLYRGEWTQGYKGRYGVRYSTNSQAKYQGTWSSGLQDGYGTEAYADGGTYMGQWLRGMRHGYGSRRSAAFGVAAKHRGRSHAHASLTSLRSEQGDDVIPVVVPPPATAADGVNGKPGLSKDDETGGEEIRGGFVLRARSEPPQRRRRSLSERSLAVKRSIFQGLRITKQHSTGDLHQRVVNATGSLRSSGSTMSCASDDSYATGGGSGVRETVGGAHRHKHHTTGDDSNMVPPPEETVDPNAVESYAGEWKNDKRSGFGVADRTDGLKYEGEWFNNKKFGYGVTTRKDGTREEGKYKNNVLVSSQRKKHALFVRSSKLRERIEAAVAAANRAAQIAAQKADIAISRTATSRDRSEQAELFAQQSQEDCLLARNHARQFDPTFRQPGPEMVKRQLTFDGNHVAAAHSTPPMRAAYSLDTTDPSLSLRSSTTDDATSTTVSRPSVQHNQTTVVAAPRSFVIPPPTADRSHEDDATHRQAAAYSPVTPPMVTPPSEMTTPRLEPPLVPPSVYHAATAAASNPAASPVPNQIAYVPHLSSEQYYTDHQPGLSGVAANRHPPPAVNAVHYAPSPYDTGFSHHPPRTANALSGAAGASHSGSRVSLTLNDHYDQYAMRRASLARSHAVAATTSSAAPRKMTYSGGSVSPTLANRRFTLTDAAASPFGLANGGAAPPDDSMSYSGEVADDHRHVFSATSGASGGTMPAEPRGSLPDVSQLAAEPMVLGRDEAARLSSQRRQEMHRMAEENELLRGNPLRYVFHPAVRAWMVRWKLPLVVAVVNLCLSLIFMQLLTYRKPAAGGDDAGAADDDS